MSVIDFENKVIFVHIPKTAGSSMEKALGGTGDKRGHLTITEIADFFNQHTLGVNTDDFFKFAFVRNPLDRLVSVYATVGSPGDMSGFNDWIKEHEDATPFRTQKSFLYDEAGNLKVDFVGKFENLEADWKTVCERTGKNMELPFIETTSIPLEKPYSQYYTPETEAIVREWLKEDFELFNYE
jgi:hypothetical protein